MGDFLLDLRHRSERCDQAERLRFYPDMVVDRIEREMFTLFVSRTGSDRLWAPYESPDGVVVAVAGRVALDARKWEDSARIDDTGGLACKAIYQAFRERGIESLGELSGGFAIHVYDAREGVYHLVNDRGGAFPCYSPATTDEIVCSHPDVLAHLLGKGASPSVDSPDAWDLTSMAEFISTGVVSYPYSYYRQVVALDFGSIHCFGLGKPGPRRRTTTRYANWQTENLSDDTDEDIAERLAQAITVSARMRTLPILGKTAIALSGGLDSRTILCAAQRHEHLLAFCAFDQQNAEFRYAKSIADSLGVRLIPFERDFDHYADNAEMGVRISGGMGELASNHFLGFRDRLRQLGVENLVTGCYFDYLFKSLALDAREQGILRRERLGEFSFQTYLPHFSISQKYNQGLTDRMDALFPLDDRLASDSVTHARNAMRRIFPLYHEGDNAQRLIPQRVMDWYSAAVDPGLLELCRIIPPEMKLNKHVFRMAIMRVCGEAISNIPDANTGLPISASAFRVGMNRYLIALRRRLERRRMRMSTEESWPNWPYYVRSSNKLRTLWQRPNPLARELIEELTGEAFRENVASYGDRSTQYFMRLLTLKLWLDQRGSYGLP